MWPRSVHVDDILRRWVAEDLAGLHNKSHRPHRSATKQRLGIIRTMKTLQQNPALGEFGDAPGPMCDVDRIDPIAGGRLEVDLRMEPAGLERLLDHLPLRPVLIPLEQSAERGVERWRGVTDKRGL
jgi:hypothetical protein